MEALVLGAPIDSKDISYHDGSLSCALEMTGRDGRVCVEARGKRHLAERRPECNNLAMSVCVLDLFRSPLTSELSSHPPANRKPQDRAAGEANSLARARAVPADTLALRARPSHR